MVIFINLVQTRFTEVPPPPKRPEHFRTRDELKKYLQKVHEYHLIVGRWRIRRQSDEYPLSSISNNDLFQFFDVNNDHYISNNELKQRLKFKKED